MNKVADFDKNAIFAEEALVVDVQIFLNTLMHEKGVSRSDLAKAMGVSRARISQLFSDECTNLTVRLFARAAYALGEKVELDCDHFRLVRERSLSKAMGKAENVWPLWKHVEEEGDKELDVYHDKLLVFLGCEEMEVAA
ncbi:helix-turn-helix transcriptional regulator [Rhizorhabdus wittichii]|uniref:Helix-turn-helix transcriptional regulator n=1 Tax=Rhizorhabdus wittichii TaxID=160791 RepID=A0A975D7B0_9SPHN|nr:helix-turn-helix transcriptional regulator [Rhizorhabdus wittichii]QTH24049.1 helix-turn-helix transcriptional regulator [Rhizorhabdus wittichii]